MEENCGGEAFGGAKSLAKASDVYVRRGFV